MPHINISLNLQCESQEQGQMLHGERERILGIVV